MASFNCVHLVGYLGANPELITSAKSSYTHFSIGVSDPFSKNQDGSFETDWFNCVAFGASADYLCKYGFKGACIFIDGRLKTSSYQTQTGEKRISYQIVCSRVMLFSEKRNRAEQILQNENHNNNVQSEQYYGNSQSQQESINYNDDLPF